MNNPIRILLVDDSPYFLEAAREFLQYQESLTVVGVATAGDEALAQSRNLQPDIILLDLNLARSSGLELIPVFKEHLPETRIIVLTMMEETSYRAAALQAGADAFVHKSAMSKTLVSAILEAMERADTSMVNPNDNQLAGQEVHGDARFRSLFEQSNDAVFILDLQGNHVMANRRAAEMLSYTLEEVQHLSFKDISAEVQKSEQVLKRLLAGEHIPVFERKFRKKNGEIFPVEINAELVHDNAGQPLYIQSVVRDITERRRAEEALRDREAQLSGLIESAMDAIIVVDEEQHILLFNPAAEQLFKSPASEAIGSSLTRFIPEAVREKHQDYVRAFGNSDQSRRSMQTPTLELNCLRPDGEMFASEISISKFETKGHKRFIAFIRDITGRKRAEIEIQRRNEDLSLLDAVNQALNRGESLSVVVALVSNGLKKSYDGFGATIYLLDSSRQRLVNQNMALPPDLLKKIEKLVGVAIPRVELDLQRDHPFRRVFETKQIEVLNDPREVRDHYVAFAEAVPLRPVARAAAKKAMPVIQQLVRVKAEMLVPLVSNDEVIGVVDLGGRVPFTEDDVKRMESIAGQLTVAIQRKWAEETLRAVEEKYRHIFENAVEAITQTTPAGLYITANQAAARMLGFNSSEELIASVTELDRQFYVEPDRREEFKSLMEKQGVVTGFESEIRRRDGTTMWISENSQAVRDQHGTLVYYEGSAVDITERKRAEMALRRSLEQTSRARHTLQALNRAAQAAQRAHTPQAIYQAVGKEMKELGFDLVIYDFDADKQDLSVAFIPYAEGIVRAAEALTGLSASTYRFSVVPGGFYERVLSAGKAVFYDDLKSIVAESLPQQMSPLASPLGRILGATRGIYAVLKVDGKLKNILMVLGSDLGEEDLPAVDALASQISIALENARLYQNTLNTAERRAVLYDVGQEIVRVTQNAEELYAAIHRAVSKLMPAEAFTIVLHNEDRDDLEGVYLFDKGGRCDSKRIPFGQGFSSRVISSNETILIRDLEQTSLDAVHFGADDPIRSVLAVPLRNSNKVIGAISAQSYQPEAYTEEDCYMLEMLAAQASIGLENARLFDKLQRELNERKQTEKALREKTDELDRYFTSSLDLLCIADTDGYFRRLNPEWEKILGYPLADLEGQRFLDFVHPDDLPSTLAALSQLSGIKEVLNFENRYRCKDGSYRWIEWRSYPHDKLIYAVARDITERKKAERELQRRADEFSTLYDTAHDLAGETDLSTVLQTILERAISLLGTANGTLALYDNARDDLELAAVKDFPAPLGKRRRLGEGMAGIVAQTRQPLIVEDYHNWYHRIPEHDDTDLNACIEVPLIYHGELIGTLGVGEVGTTRKFTEADVRLLSLFGAQAAGAVQNAKLFAQTGRRLRHLTALREIDQAITSTFDMRVSLNVVLSWTMKLLSADAASILLVNPATNTLEYEAGIGFQTDALQTSRVGMGESYAGKAALERWLVQIPNIADEPDNLFLTEFLKDENFVSSYGMPLIVKGRVIGVLEVFNRSVPERDDEWFDFFGTLAGQAAIAVDNAQLFENLQISNTELNLAYEATIEGWSHALDLRDKETEGHTLRVTERTLDLASRMGVPDSELVHIRRGALLHDIGKMGVPDNILLKPDSLTKEEWEIMRKHPIFAFELLSPIQYLKSAAIDIPYCHHEKWDGTGYPRGLKGEQIPLSARIFAVVDVYDALTSDRPYRPGWPRQKVLEYIHSLSGKHFDPDVVEQFLRLPL